MTSKSSMAGRHRPRFWGVRDGKVFEGGSAEELMDCRLPIVNCRLSRSSNLRSRISNFKFQISDFRFLTLLGLCALLLLSNTGCSLLGIAAYKFSGPVNHPPAYALAVDPTIVIVDRPVNFGAVSLD